jgi:hypothetical protein
LNATTSGFLLILIRRLVLPQLPENAGKPTVNEQRKKYESVETVTFVFARGIFTAKRELTTT